MAQSKLETGNVAKKMSNALVCEAGNSACLRHLAGSAGWKADQLLGMRLAGLFWCLNGGI
jgi:hypothetical protein